LDPAYLSAVAALAGSAIGGLTSLTASWLSQHVQFSARQRAENINKREELYKSFIEEASRWYADAFEHDKAEIVNLVGLYAMVSRMRVFSSPAVVASADQVARTIIKAYLAPNKTFRDLTEVIDNDAMNPLREFSNACRDELQAHGSLP